MLTRALEAAPGVGRWEDRRGVNAAPPRQGPRARGQRRVAGDARAIRATNARGSGSGLDAADASVSITYKSEDSTQETQVPQRCTRTFCHRTTHNPTALTNINKNRILFA